MPAGVSAQRNDSITWSPERIAVAGVSRAGISVRHELRNSPLADSENVRRIVHGVPLCTEGFDDLAGLSGRCAVR